MRSARFLAALTVVLLGAAALPAMASAEVSTGKLIPLSDPSPGRFQDPQIAVAGDGSATVVWAKSTYSDGNHATVESSLLSHRGAATARPDFDAGGAAAYYVDPAVAVDGTGRALVAFVDIAGVVRAAFVSRDGVAGPAQELAAIGPLAGQGAHVQAAFADDGRAYVAWSTGSPNVVAFDAEGSMGEVRTLPVGSDAVRLDVSGQPRLIWSNGSYGDGIGPSGVYSAPLDAAANPGDVTQIVPPMRGDGLFYALTTSAGRILVERTTYGHRGRNEVLYARSDGGGEVRVLAGAAFPWGPHPSTGAHFRSLGLDAERGGRAIATWTRRGKAPDEKAGAVLKAVMIRGDRVFGRINGGFAGRTVSATAPALVSRGAVIVAGKRRLRAAQISPRGRIRSVDRLPGGRAKYTRSVRIAPISCCRAHVVWDRDGRMIASANLRVN